jgi:hypothetical protein
LTLPADGKTRGLLLLTEIKSSTGGFTRARQSLLRDLTGGRVLELGNQYRMRVADRSEGASLWRKPKAMQRQCGLRADIDGH